MADTFQLHIESYRAFGSAQDESSYSPMKRRSLEAAGRDAKQSKISGFFARASTPAEPSQPSKPSEDPKDEAAKSSWTMVKSTALAQNASNTVALRNGVGLPVLGFGTYRLGREVAQGIVAEALKVGYRLIDTAQVYDQGRIETAVGAALRQSNLPRSSVFISTKVWRSSHGFEKTLQACQQSLKRLQVDYIDLYLVHWPGPQPSNSKAWSPQMRHETWRAMEKLLRDGKVKAIGVCNHSIRHLKDLLKSCEIRPMVNQVEFHPLLVQSELLDYCTGEGIAVQAFASLGSGDSRRARDFFALPAVQQAARAHGAQPAAVLLRWATQKGCHVIPKSSQPLRMKQNAELFSITLSEQELQAIDACHTNARLTWWGLDPDTIE
eukprot:s804_g15.t1